MFPLLPLFLVPILPAAAADAPEAQVWSQAITYDLTIGGQRVGQRDVTIRHIPPDDIVPYESRIIESYQQVQAQVAGRRIEHTSRITARASEDSSNFVASIDENGTVREVQGRQLSDGRWTVVEVSRGSQKTWDYRRTEVNLSTMDFLDPERHRLLSDDATAGVLVAESGQVLTGSVTDLGEDALTIAGTTVPVQRLAWTPEAGKVELSWTLDGWLVAYEIGFMGQALHAQARQAPEPRTFGEIEITTTITGAASPVYEEEL